MIKRPFWHTAVLAVGIGSWAAYATTATDDQKQEAFRIMTAEESAAIQNKLNATEDAFRQQQDQESVKRAETAGSATPAILPTRNPAAKDTPEATTEPQAAAKPVAQPAPTDTQPSVQEETTPGGATQSNAPEQDTGQADAEAQAVESHKARMALRQEMIRQAAEQQQTQQKKLMEQRQETAPPRSAADAASVRRAMDQHRQQVLTEIKNYRRQSQRRVRREPSKAADIRAQQQQDALKTLLANESARKQEMAQRREAAEKAMQAHREEMEQRIQQRQRGMPPGPHKSREEIMSSMQDHRQAMQEYMAKRHAEQKTRQTDTEQESQALAQAEEHRATMEARYKQRRAEMAARSEALRQSIDAAIDNMGRNPWGQPPSR